MYKMPTVESFPKEEGHIVLGAVYKANGENPYWFFYNMGEDVYFDSRLVLKVYRSQMDEENGRK